MGWNRPSEEKKVEVEGKGRQRNGRLKGLIAGGIVVVGVAVAAWWIFGGGPAPVREDADGTKKGLIKEVTPAKAPTNEVAKRVRNPNTVIWRGKEYPRFDKNGGEAIVTGYGVRYLTPHVITNSGANKARIPWEVKPFRHSTDKDIAILICTEPGTAFVDEAKYDPDFTQKFLKSLKEPIVVSDDDPEEVQMLKRDVIALRKELKDRYDRGEDIAQVMFEAQQEQRQLGAYQMDLRNQVQKIARDRKLTEKDLDDLEAAANEMLKSRGIDKPLVMPSYLRRGARLRALRRTQDNLPTK